MKVASYFLLLVLSGCGSSSGTGGGTGGGTGDDAKCSTDGSEALVPGTYIFSLSSSVSKKQKTQVRILKSDCTYCFETVTDGDSTDLTPDGKWTSKLGNKIAGQQIDITVGTITYVLSGDGLTLRESSSVWSKTLSSSYSCD